MKDLINQFSKHKTGRNKMSKTKLGKAKYGSSKRTYFKLKDGESVYRILPPLGELADDGRWSVFYNVHYGYKNVEGRNRPFQSPLVKNRKTKMVEVPDAALERIDMLKAQLDKAKVAKDKKTVDGLLKYVGGQKSQYNLDSNHYLNVLDLQGNIGVLKIRHRCKIALDATIKDLRDKGVDPLSADNGRYFVFRRTGTALDTSFQVTVYKEKMNAVVNGETLEVEKDVVSKLNDELIDRLGSEAAELGKLFRTPSEEEVARLVSESNLATGVSPNIDDILGFKSNGTAPEAEADAEDYTDTPDEAPPETKVEAKTETKKTEPAAAKVTPKTTPKTTPKVEPLVAQQTTADRVADMSEDDFLASIGLK
jgi:hypothetical protein